MRYAEAMTLLPLALACAAASAAMPARVPRALAPMARYAEARAFAERAASANGLAGTLRLAEARAELHSRGRGAWEYRFFSLEAADSREGARLDVRFKADGGSKLTFERGAAVPEWSAPALEPSADAPAPGEALETLRRAGISLGEPVIARLLFDGDGTRWSFIDEKSRFATVAGGAAAPGVVSDAQVERAAATVVSYKGGRWTSREYAELKAGAAGRLKAAGATPVQLARFESLCEAAPVKGGAFNRWQGATLGSARPTR